MRDQLVHIVADILSVIDPSNASTRGDAEAVVDAILPILAANDLMHESTLPTEVEPEYVGHPKNPEPTPERVRSAYANLVGWMERVNALLPEGQRAMIPFSLQHVLRLYIDERETVAHLLRGTPDA